MPVPDVVYDEKTEITVGTYTPMARKIGETENYQGVLYDLNKAIGSQKVYDFASNGVGTTVYREPSLITGDDNVTSAIGAIAGTEYDIQYYSKAGIYSNVEAFGKDMQDEYDNMVKSVAKYGGFYVGRYETGIENGKAVSKNAATNTSVTTADVSQTETNMWYGLYNKQRTMAKDNELKSVESSMIWGSQYDAMMIWMQKTGTVIGTGYDTTKRKAGEKVTGNSPNDIINKVYDLYGCHYEWTLESCSSSIRMARAYSLSMSCVPSGHDFQPPNVPANMYNSRLTLYVND